MLSVSKKKTKKKKEKKKRKKKQKKREKKKKKGAKPVAGASSATAEGYKYVPRRGSNVTTAAAGWAESVVAVAAKRSRVRPPVLAVALSHELVIKVGKAHQPHQRH
jgi:hypothetical protein